MGYKGLLIDYEFCTGCHTCEVACQMEHNLSADRWGIKITQVGPWKNGQDDYTFIFIPAPTNLCDLCADRVSAGKLPTCVHHCLAHVIRFGEIAELSIELEKKTNQVLYVIE